MLNDLAIWKRTKVLRDGLWDNIPRSLKESIAPKLARTRPLSWYPGWTFAASESENSFAHLTRRKLWEDYYNQSHEARIVIPWLENLKINSYLGNDISRCVYVSGNYEPNEFMFMSLVLKPGMVFMDVGANEGLYTLFASKKVADGKVIALEPSKREFARLTDNLYLNRCENVHAIQAGASNTEGNATLKVATSGHTGLNTLGEISSSVKSDSEIIKLVTIDGLMTTLKIDRLDFMKIDVEGAELAVLKGAAQSLRKFHPILQIEIFSRALQAQNSSVSEVYKFLEELGYIFYRFGRSGKPESIGDSQVDEANIIAVHQSQKSNIEELIR